MRCLVGYGTAVCLFVLACGPSVDPGDGEGSVGASEEGTTDASATDPSASASASSVSESDSMGPSSVTVVTTDPTDTSGEGGCGPNPCEPCAPSCVDEPACIDGEWMCNCSCPDPDPGCPSSPWSDFANMSKTEPLECGAVDENDDAAAWQAMHDCVLAQSAVEAAFWASWHPEGDDFSYGVAGAVGFAYALAYFEKSGFGDTLQYECTAFAATDGCVVATNEPCLTCVGQGEGETICLGPK